MMRRTMIAAAAIAATTAAVWAQSPERQGRYSMSPAEGGGFARLDTETGAVSICQKKDADWACREMEDEGRKLRSDNERLSKENNLLKDELKRLEDVVAGIPGRPGKDRPGEQFKLPSEEDVDKALDYVDRMFKKFRDKLKELDRDKNATPL